MAATPEDAATGAYAKVTGQSIGEIAQNNPDFLEMKESKKISIGFSRGLATTPRATVAN